MADGRLRAEWGQTSAILAMLANVNRDPKRRRRPYTSNDFNPYHAPRRSSIGRRLGRDISMDQFANELIRTTNAKGRRKR